MLRLLFTTFIKFKFNNLLFIENNRAPKKNNKVFEKVPVKKLLDIKLKKN